MTTVAQKHLTELVSLAGSPLIEIPSSPSTTNNVYQQLVFYHERCAEYWKSQIHMNEKQPAKSRKPDTEATSRSHLQVSNTSFSNSNARSQGSMPNENPSGYDPYSRQDSVKSVQDTSLSNPALPVPVLKPKPAPIKPIVHAPAAEISPNSDSSSFQLSPPTHHPGNIHSKHSYVPPAIAPQHSFHHTSENNREEPQTRKRAVSSPASPDPKFMQSIAQQAQGVQRRMSSVESPDNAKAMSNAANRLDAVQIQEEEEEDETMSPEEDEKMYNRATRNSSFAAPYRPAEPAKQEVETDKLDEPQEDLPQGRRNSKTHKLTKKKSEKANDEKAKEKGKGFFGMFSGKE